MDDKMIASFPHGDMPGDKIRIEEHHIEKAQVIFPELKRLLSEAKTVICVCGGSGVGKSEIASVLAGFLEQDGIHAYVMSGDNYPHRIPAENDAMRLSVWEKGGEAALADYLGSQQEIDFQKVDDILHRFRAGDKIIPMKRMGRTPEELWYDDVDFSDVSVLILEWTHGNSDLLTGVDIPILLNSTPQETLAHRKLRARDGAVDSPFTTLVLTLEQKMLHHQAHKAKIIITKDGDRISYPEYLQRMEGQL